MVSREPHVTLYAYDDKAALVSTTTALGNVTGMTYDSRGRLSTVTDAAGAVSSYEYDARGNRSKTIDPLNRQTTMTYDAAGNMATITDPAGRVSRWEYDGVGRATKVIDPANGETRYTYEPGGAGGGCSGGCGGGGAGGGLLTSVTDPTGHATGFEYDATGRMTAVVNPLGIRREYTYDPAGRLTRFKNGRGQEITYTYDLSNNLLKKTLPDEGDVDYSYDVDNRVTQMTDADSILRYTYATVTREQFGWLKGAKIQETYGLKTDPRYAKQASGSTTLGYYSSFRNASGTTTWTAESLANVNMTTDLSLPGNVSMSNMATFEYDVDHKVISQNNGNYYPLTFGYDPVGRRTSMAIGTGMGGAGLTAHYTYDAAGQLLHLTQQDKYEAAVGDYTYTYDNAGNRTTMTDSAGTHSYGYDDKYQLTSVTNPATPAEAFAYDATGNRTVSNQSPSYTYNDANQLLDDAEFTYSYDADGNCIGKISKVNGERHEYIFNSENRMTGYRKYDVGGALVTTANYYYDVIGRRIAKEVNGALSRYMYYQENIWQEIIPGGVLIKYRHGPGIDEPLVAWYSGGDGMGGSWYAPLFYYADGLGTIRETKKDFDPWQVFVSSKYEYSSFGQLVTGALQAAIYSFTGREFDPESGLLFLRNRYYDPHTGQFVSVDPYGVVPRVPKVHPEYSYADQKPINLMDPFGLESQRQPQTQPCAQDRACCIACLFNRSRNTGVEHGATLRCDGTCDYKGSGTPTHVDIPITLGTDCDQLHTHPNC